MSSKRKRNVLTIATKLKALEFLDKGESTSVICDDLNIGKSVLNDWRRNRTSLQYFTVKVETEKMLSNICTMKKGKNEIVDDAFLIWFVQERRKGTPLSRPILKEKAVTQKNQHRRILDE